MKDKELLKIIRESREINRLVALYVIKDIGEKYNAPATGLVNWLIEDSLQIENTKCIH